MVASFVAPRPGFPLSAVWPRWAGSRDQQRRSLSGRLAIVNGNCGGNMAREAERLGNKAGRFAPLPLLPLWTYYADPPSGGRECSGRYGMGWSLRLGLPQVWRATWAGGVLKRSSSAECWVCHVVGGS